MLRKAKIRVLIPTHRASAAYQSVRRTDAGSAIPHAVISAANSPGVTSAEAAGRGT